MLGVAIVFRHRDRQPGLVTAGSEVRTNDDGSVTEAIWAADDNGRLRVLLLGRAERGQDSPVLLRSHYPPGKNDGSGLWIHGTKTPLHSGLNAYLIRNDVVTPMNLDDKQREAVQAHYRDWKDAQWERFLATVGVVRTAALHS